VNGESAGSEARRSSRGSRPPCQATSAAGRRAELGFGEGGEEWGIGPGFGEVNGESAGSVLIWVRGGDRIERKTDAEKFGSTR
jgi:hypothetical protein